MNFKGTENIKVDKQGELVLETKAGEIHQHKPVVYQEINGEKKIVAGKYVVNKKREVNFKLGSYDKSKQLVIDPVVVFYSTFIQHILEGMTMMVLSQ